MNEVDDKLERARQLVSRLVDDDLAPADGVELNELLRDDPSRLQLVADHLLLDAMLAEELGGAALDGLVDAVGDDGVDARDDISRNALASGSEVGGISNRTLARAGSGTGRVLATWWRAGWVAAAIVLVLGAFWMGRLENSALANATELVRAAIDAHAAPVERVYLVRVERTESDGEPPREVRVVTQGDRFYVEMNRGERRWVWGRDANGAIWLTAGTQRALRIEPDEIGPPLQQIAELYSLNVESLLQTLLRDGRVEYSADNGSTHEIVARLDRRATGHVRQARLEVDKETKAVRRLELDRESPRRGSTTITFTLVEARAPDETKYQPAGHLTEPSRLFTRASRPDRRREWLANWFGATADRWIQEEK